MYDVKESDWKLLRKLVPGWQERYMDKLNREYIEIQGKMVYTKVNCCLHDDKRSLRTSDRCHWCGNPLTFRDIFVTFSV